MHAVDVLDKTVLRTCNLATSCRRYCTLTKIISYFADRSRIEA